MARMMEERQSLVETSVSMVVIGGWEGRKLIHLVLALG